MRWRGPDTDLSQYNDQLNSGTKPRHSTWLTFILLAGVASQRLAVCNRLPLWKMVVTRPGTAHRLSRARPATHEAGKLNGGAVKVHRYLLGTVYLHQGSGAHHPCRPALPASVCNNKDMMNWIPQHIDITFWTGGRVRSLDSLDRKHGATQDDGGKEMSSGRAAGKLCRTAHHAQDTAARMHTRPLRFAIRFTYLITHRHRL